MKWGHEQDKFPNAKIVHGSTEVGIELKFKNCNYPALVYATDVPELVKIVESGKLWCLLPSKRTLALK